MVTEPAKLEEVRERGHLALTRKWEHGTARQSGKERGVAVTSGRRGSRTGDRESRKEDRERRLARDTGGGGGRRLRVALRRYHVHSSLRGWEG